MFDELVAAASASGSGAVGAWARVENAACARKLAAIADVLERRLAADGSAEREQWCLDNWDAVCAEIGAVFNVSLGVASHQLMLACALRDRLPRVAEVFAAGQISYRVVNAIVYRSALVVDSDARAKVDIEIAAQVAGWGPLSVAKTELAIDDLVGRHDPQALRRLERRARDRHLDIAPIRGGAGMAGVEGVLFEHDAAVLDRRLDALAAAVCADDPRTVEQRRADAMGALARGEQELGCLCGAAQCVAGGQRGPWAAVVVHVIAGQDSMADDSRVLLDGAEPPPDGSAKPLRERTLAEALAPDAPRGTANTDPAVIVGGGLLPAPLLAAKVAGMATIGLVVHPCDAPPESRYTPSRGLADFVRCRDMTCRFPGCDEPAYVCDLDHTIAYPVGPTCASNLKCLCRKHHLLKTFWGWCETQSPDSTVVWRAPNGQTYTTHPGSRLLFPALCEPTAPVDHRLAAATDAPSHGVAMPRRTRTREQNRADRITAQRRLNDARVAEHDRPPPF